MHYPTLHYTRPITPLQYDCSYTTLVNLHHNYSSTTLQLRVQLQYTTLHPAVVGEVTTLQPLQRLQQTQLQPPFGQSVDSLCHPWFTTTNLSERFPVLKLPPPPCAVLLVFLDTDERKRWRKHPQCLVGRLFAAIEMCGFEDAGSAVISTAVDCTQDCIFSFTPAGRHSG